MLKLEHLSPYLPYKLNILREGKIVELCGLNKPYKTNDNFYIRGETKVINGTYKSTLSFMVDSKSIINFKPILRPMSDLNDSDLIKDWRREHSIEFNECGLQLKTIDAMYINVLLYPLEFINQLFENHFDVFSLIDKGLAVSIHDIPKTEK